MISENRKIPDYYTPKTSNSNLNESVAWSEWKIASYCLIGTITIVLLKIFTNYGSIIFEEKLITSHIFTEDGSEMLIFNWKNAIKYSNIWLPIVCGVFCSYFTWFMVYLDSEQPGIHPPSPFSPKKYKDQSGHIFHLNYIFSIIIGLLVTSYMFFKGFSIIY